MTAASRRSTRAAAVVVTAVAVLTSCGTPESRAEGDARDLVRERLTIVEDQLAGSLAGFDPATDTAAVATWVPTTYRHAVEGGRVTIEFGIREVGRDDLSVGETTVAGGACFRVVGTRSGGRIGQVDCPTSFLREPGRPVDTEVRVIDAVRPLVHGEPRPSYPPSGG